MTKNAALREKLSAAQAATGAFNKKIFTGRL
jgi:hypothetical protein